MTKGRIIGTRVAALAFLLLVGCSGPANQQVAVPPADPPQVFDPSRELAPGPRSTTVDAYRVDAADRW